MYNPDAHHWLETEKGKSNEVEYMQSALVLTPN